MEKWLSDRRISEQLISMLPKEAFSVVAGLSLEIQKKGFDFLETGALASYNLWLASQMVSFKVPFSIVTRRVIDEEIDDVTISEATMKISVDEKTGIFVADGNGPVNALDACLRKGLLQFFPKEDWLSEVNLVDFSVTDLSKEAGSAARIRVMMVFSWHKRKWTTIGCHENIITASRQAIGDGYCYPFFLKEFIE